MKSEDLIAKALNGKRLFDPSNPARDLTFVGFDNTRKGGSATVKLRDSTQPAKTQVTDYSLSYFLQLEEKVQIEPYTDRLQSKEPSNP